MDELLLGVDVGPLHIRFLLIDRFGSPYQPKAAIRIPLGNLGSWQEVIDAGLEQLGKPAIQ